MVNRVSSYFPNGGHSATDNCPRLKYMPYANSKTAQSDLRLYAPVIGNPGQWDLG